MDTNKPFAFGAAGQGTGTSATFNFGAGAGKGFAGLGTGQAGFGIGQPPAPMGQQSLQPTAGTLPSLFGQQSTLGQNQPPTGVASTPQGQQAASMFPQGQGQTIFGNSPAQNLGQPGGAKLFNLGTQPSSGLGGLQTGTMGQAVPSIFPPPSGQMGTTQMSRPATTQPQVLNMYSQFQSTATPSINPQSSVAAAQKSGGLSFFAQPSGQPSGQPQGFAMPSQSQGGMQLGVGTQMQSNSFLQSSLQGQPMGFPPTTKSGFSTGQQPFPYSQPQATSQPPTSLQQSQLFLGNPQKQTPHPSQLFPPPQTTQPSQSGQIFATPHKTPTAAQPSQMGQVSQPIMTSHIQMTQPIASIPQQPQFYTTPQKQPVMTSSQFTTPQTQGFFATTQPHLQSTAPNLAAPQSQAPAQLPAQSSGQSAVFQLQSSPSTALPTSATPSTTPSSVPVPSLSSTAPLPHSQPQTTLSLQSQLKQPLIMSPATSAPTTKIPTATTTTSLPIISTSTSGSVTQTPAKKYTYRQLEDVINQWVLELGEQQKVFVNQARQINAWDVALLENEESIISLHNEVERAKSDQDRLNHDLDSILGQQSELEEMLRPLEGFLDNQTVHASTQLADQERNKTYGMAERIDTNMKDMMQNLREVMEKINTVNSANYDRSNPISQITGILNAHMDSLLFIDENTNALQQKVDELSKKQDSKKQDQETKLRSAFS